MASTQVKDGFNGGSDNQLRVLADGSINVNTASSSTTIDGPVTTETAGLNAFQTSQYAIGSTATQLAPTPLPNRSSISITVEASPNVAVYIGNSSAVTVATGYPLYDGSTIQLDLTPSGQVWAVCATTGSVIATLEIA